MGMMDMATGMMFRSYRCVRVLVSLNEHDVFEYTKGYICDLQGEQRDYPGGWQGKLGPPTIMERLQLQRKLGQPTIMKRKQNVMRKLYRVNLFTVTFLCICLFLCYYYFTLYILLTH
jgi:hypothetical protein